VCSQKSSGSIVADWLKFEAGMSQRHVTVAQSFHVKLTEKHNFQNDSQISMRLGKFVDIIKS
jgi:hypothetical protein